MLLLAAELPLGKRELESLNKHAPGRKLKVIERVLDEHFFFDEDREERQRYEKLLSEALKISTALLRRMKSTKAFSAAEFHQQSQEVQRFSRDLVQIPLKQIIVDPSEERSPALHRARVFLLTLALAQSQLGWIATERERLTRQSLSLKQLKNLVALGQAALMADLGELLEGEEREHPLRSLSLLPPGASPLIKATILGHHENMEGGGYPKGIPAKRLHVFVRLLRLTDAFERAISGERALSPPRVLWRLRFGPQMRCWDPELIAHLGRLLQVFPVGSRLRLKDGRVAVVLRYNREEPLCPGLLVAYNRRGRRLPLQEMQGPFYWGEEDPPLKLSSYAGDDLSELECPKRASQEEDG